MTSKQNGNDKKGEKPVQLKSVDANEIRKKAQKEKEDALAKVAREKKAESTMRGNDKSVEEAKQPEKGSFAKVAAKIPKIGDPKISSKDLQTTNKANQPGAQQGHKKNLPLEDLASVMSEHARTHLAKVPEMKISDFKMIIEKDAKVVCTNCINEAKVKITFAEEKFYACGQSCALPLLTVRLEQQFEKGAKKQDESDEDFLKRKDTLKESAKNLQMVHFLESSCKQDAPVTMDNFGIVIDKLKTLIEDGRKAKETQNSFANAQFEQEKSTEEKDTKQRAVRVELEKSIDLFTLVHFKNEDTSILPNVGDSFEKLKEFSMKRNSETRQCRIFLARNKESLTKEGGPGALSGFLKEIEKSFLADENVAKFWQEIKPVLERKKVAEAELKKIGHELLPLAKLAIVTQRDDVMSKALAVLPMCKIVSLASRVNDDEAKLQAKVDEMKKEEAKLKNAFFKEIVKSEEHQKKNLAPYDEEWAEINVPLKTTASTIIDELELVRDALRNMGEILNLRQEVLHSSTAEFLEGAFLQANVVAELRRRSEKEINASAERTKEKLVWALEKDELVNEKKRFNEGWAKSQLDEKALANENETLKQEIEKLKSENEAFHKIKTIEAKAALAAAAEKSKTGTNKRQAERHEHKAQCAFYLKKEGCRKGDDCKFAHGEKPTKRLKTPPKVPSRASFAKGKASESEDDEAMHGRGQ